MLIQDQDERERALDPKQSFIVQAPAGSGKTDILMKRYLVLLSVVNQPEEVLAITFTKKSAAEMRARTMHALLMAQTVSPLEPNAKKLWHLARKVLNRDQALQWNLLNNPNRLRFQTIDSFNAFITKNLPILSLFGASPTIIDNPTALYSTAIHELLAHLDTDSPFASALADVLLHMDNDLTKVEDLLIQLLLKRDQWLPYITLDTDDPKIREILEKNLTAISTDLLKKLHPAFPTELIYECLALARFAATNLLLDHSDSPITLCAELTQLPGSTAQDKTAWLALSHLLLTNDFSWRKRFDKTLGFPAASSSSNPDEKKDYQQQKERINALMIKLHEYPELQMLLKDLRLAPHLHYSESQWHILHFLLQILRLLVAELKIVFKQRGEIDYIENAAAALVALGDIDAPTDLTLALDYQIKHILIDEFQDTSTSQYRLLEKIIAGWEVNDGRTLFVVGDPMQSIYRFREAEVGLFIRACQKGIGNIKLIPLQLKTNFRSSQKLVNWINSHFKSVFPMKDDITMGGVAYNASIAYHETRSELSTILLHPAFNTSEKEDARRIIKLITDLKQAKPNDSIAILVRSRSHLAEIIPALKSAQLAYRAIDIDPLHSRPVIQDLIALTRALTHPADRIAWFALLRSPYCGFSLNDLLIIAGNNPFSILWERIRSFSDSNRLSQHGQTHLNRILPILKLKMNDRNRYSLRAWIESTWLLLGGPASIHEANGIDDANTFFHLLETLDEGGNLKSLAELNKAIEKLYAAPNLALDATIQIMTIHNAKGLEFDTVILPHLERQNAHDDNEMLLWMEQARLESNPSLILAPIEPANSDDHSIYNYIKKQEAIKTEFENGRLLYVAATRAKQALHLFFSLDQHSEEIKPRRHSMLEKLWPAIHATIIQEAPAVPAAPPCMTQDKNKILSRLTNVWINPLKEFEHASKIHYHTQTGFQLPNYFSKKVGTTVHFILQQMARLQPAWWDQQSVHSQNRFLENFFLKIGMLTAHIPEGIRLVRQAITHTLNDPRGRWLLEPHYLAESELPLTALINQQIHAFIIDRTFVDQANQRWIIDFKTSSTDHDLETFLEKEKEKYFQKLSYYADAIRQNETRSIKIGLYFPLIPAWVEWDNLMIN